MGKITFKSLVSATVQVTNGDEQYAITANAQVTSGKAQNVDSGHVELDGAEVANFNFYGTGNFNVNFNNVDEEHQVAILAAVNEFITNVKAAAYTCTVILEEGGEE